MKNTDTKDRILDFLFDFPTKKFNLREISRILKISPPAVSNAIKSLAKEKLIEIERKFALEITANRTDKFTQNKRVHNLKSIYSSGLYDYLKDNFSLSTIILFGSYSKGEDIERSDIDIAILAKEKSLKLEEFEKKLNREINVEFLDLKKASKELKDIIINGIRLQGYIET